MDRQTDTSKCYQQQTGCLKLGCTWFYAYVKTDKWIATQTGCQDSFTQNFLFFSVSILNTRAFFLKFRAWSVRTSLLEQYARASQLWQLRRQSPSTTLCMLECVAEKNSAGRANPIILAHYHLSLPSFQHEDETYDIVATLVNTVAGEKIFFSTRFHHKQ